ncbi:hypothetical protein PPL_08439 [Heterostelium album PN500]|uniref:COI1 F-box domain-containing protein n=1 Tax=Heterostelium pallidum (strain ATCC 26659 / Pp 5 / PN500) TaxID=670386 RepID=D3BI71_HETP5|nr:hypothetical protein PPL_08439 [Heterostelium album PN500]EFA78971.1 hypothetical protein PPL_08439 [Heterostelium album PN500]|eukprot:XP_020431095.1 hypothetical protein PPL_08439 [Heterostelium album PN500]
MDDNKTNILVNLSHLLLSKIVNYLEDNIDRIVFTLVCKRWFEERDKYLYFNTDHIYMINHQNNSKHHLNSYRSSINQSLSQKSNCRLIINDKAFKCDYVLDKDL